MRVLMVTGAIPDARASSGASVVMAGQLAAMASRHQVTLVTFPPASADQQDALARWRAAGVAVHTAAAAVPPRVVHAKRQLQRAIARLGSRGPRLEPTGGDARTQAVIDRLLARETFDIIQASSIGVGAFSYPRTTPRVLSEHEVGRFGSETSDDWRVRQPIIWTPFDRVQVWTPLDADRFRVAAPALADRVRVNPPGIDMPQPADPAGESSDTVVFIGSFNHFPNVDAATWLAEAIFPRIVRVRPGARLLLVGEDPPARVLHLAGPGTSVTGRVPDVDPYLRAATVVVAPVRAGGGMRRKVLHALALGKAVVSTRLGAQGLAGPQADVPLALGDTAAEFGDHVARLLADTPARRALGLRARAHVAAHHTWAAHVDRLDAIYGELVSR